MTEETILQKLERLFKMRRLLKEKKLKRIKDKRLKYGQLDWEDEDDDEDELMSRPELIEEALKEYMYQFGLSIYQNKQGDYYFKSFADDIDLRDFDELDAHHFSLREREPNFLEKLLENVPEDKIMLTSNMETAVLDLYEKDATMSDILDQMTNNEIAKCQEILEAVEAVYEAEGPVRAEEENTAGVEKEVSAEDNEVYEPGAGYETTSVYEAEAAMSESQMPEISSEEKWEAYRCGEERAEKVSLPKPKQVRRVRKPQSNILPAGMIKDNTNNR